MSKDQDRRRFPRYARDLPVTFQTLAAKLIIQCPHCDGRIHLEDDDMEPALIQGWARTQSMSLGGISMLVDRGFPIGKWLLLQFPLRGLIIGVRGVVVMCQDRGEGWFHLGVEFVGLPEEYRQLLADYFADSLLEEARHRSFEEGTLDIENMDTTYKTYKEIP